MNISIDTSVTFQTFEGIGASGAWWAQEVGSWPGAREEIARLLYNRESGIGMRTYRYNLGAGSAESGHGDIGNPLRRTHLFSDDENAVRMAELACGEGAGELILFVNSPPESLTINHCAHCDKSRPFRTNIRKENYPAFASYVLDSAEALVKKGLPLKYISPVNEPLWVWNGGQEGCHYSPDQARAVMRVFAEELEKRPALTGVKLSGVENGDIRWFNKSYTIQLLRDKTVRKYVDSVDVHSYFLNPVRLPGMSRAGYLRRFRRFMDLFYPDVPVKMSEWTHMQGGRDYSMKSALVMAKTMVEDLTILNVTSWQHWIACSEVDYCDGLIYINLEDKTFETTKRYYATGNISKYVPFGSVRVQSGSDDPDVDALAFLCDGKVIIIAVNYSGQNKPVKITGAPESAFAAVTDDDSDLTEKTCGGDIWLTPRSVTTFICEE